MKLKSDATHEKFIQSIIRNSKINTFAQNEDYHVTTSPFDLGMNE